MKGKPMTAMEVLHDMDFSKLEMRVLQRGAEEKIRRVIEAQRDEFIEHLVFAMNNRVGINPSPTGRKPTNPIFQQNSVHKLEALVPIRVATSQPLEGDWQGPELTATRVIGSAFGGKHFILQLGYEQQVGKGASFRLVFVTHMPSEDLKSPEAIADAERTAVALMHMLNMRRKAPPMAFNTDEKTRPIPRDMLLAELKELGDLKLPGERPKLK